MNEQTPPNYRHSDSNFSEECCEKCGHFTVASIQYYEVLICYKYPFSVPEFNGHCDDWE